MLAPRSSLWLRWLALHALAILRPFAKCWICAWSGIQNWINTCQFSLSKLLLPPVPTPATQKTQKTDTSTDVTIWSPSSHFPHRCYIATKSVSPAVVEIKGPYIYWGTHDLDRYGSRDVISHVTIRFAIGHFLLVVLWNQTSISTGFRDILSQTSCALRRTLNRHCAHARYHVICRPIPCKI